MNILFKMSKIIKKIAAYLLIVLFSSTLTSFADENFCLDKQGFILPIFDQSNCETSSEIKINEVEFMHIIEFEELERITELENFRQNQIENNQKTKLASKSVEEIKKIEQNKKINIQKKISSKAKEEKQRLAKEEEFDLKNKKKENQEKLRLAKKKEQELKKQQRLAEIKKRKEEKEKLRLAKKKQKELEKQKKLAELEKKRLRDQKLKAEKELARNKIQYVENVNKNLKIVYFNKKIVKKELFPSINNSQSVDFLQLDSLDGAVVDKLFSENSNLILIIPEDFDTFSTTTSENEVSSTYVAGTKSIPNPEINRIESELRSAERDYLIAERNFQRSTNAATAYNPSGGWASIFTQLSGLAGQAAAGEKRNNARQRYERWSAKLSSTPLYLENEVLRNYNYITNNITAEKEAKYKIINAKNYNYTEKNISIKKNKNFKIAYNIDPEDKNYNTLVDKYENENDITRWQNQKFLNLSINELLNVIQKENDFSNILEKKDLYASLNINWTFEKEPEPEKELSWWQKITGKTEKKEPKTTSLNQKSKSGYELKDERFDSVVIVNTEKGLGSGFFVNENEILTNYHVIENASTITVTNKFNKRSSAIVIKKDLKRDLALLKTNFKGKPVIFYEGQLKQGEQVEALGHPKGRKFSLTKGWISAIRKESGGYSSMNEKNVLFIQTDAAINPGNSGGPLYYKNKVIGVNTQGLNKNKTEGMNFAVHFSEVNKFLSK